MRPTGFCPLVQQPVTSWRLGYLGDLHPFQRHSLRSTDLQRRQQQQSMEQSMKYAHSNSAVSAVIKSLAAALSTAQQVHLASFPVHVTQGKQSASFVHLKLAILASTATPMTDMTGMTANDPHVTRMQYRTMTPQQPAGVCCSITIMLASQTTLIVSCVDILYIPCLCLF